MVRGGPNSGMTIPLTASPVTLGRRSDNDVVVDETTVSRRHALIMESPDGYVVRDLSTTNGTYVNLDKIGHGERLLNNGDRIRLAGSKVTFIFRSEGSGTIRMTRNSPPTGMVDMSELREKREYERRGARVSAGARGGTPGPLSSRASSRFPAHA